MRCRSIQQFCGAHHTPGLDALVTNLVPWQSDVRDGPVYLQCLGQGLEAATDQGWHFFFVVLPSKPDHWNPANNWHSSEKCRISLIQNLEKQSRNPRFHSASTYSMTYSWVGSIWQLNSIRDERWNYSTCKTIQTSHCKRISKTWHHEIPQHSAILRSPPHTRPWRPRRQSGCQPNWCSWRTRLSSVPRPRPGGSDKLRLASC